MGIAREAVTKLAARAGMQIEGRRIATYDLYCADEVLFRSTAGWLSSVTKIDGRVIGDG